MTRRLAQNGRFYFFGSFCLSVKFRRFHQMLYLIYFRDQWPPAGFEATLRHAEFLDDLYTYLNWAISHEGPFYSRRSCRLLKPACTPLQMLYIVYFRDQWPPIRDQWPRGAASESASLLPWVVSIWQILRIVSAKLSASRDVALHASPPLGGELLLWRFMWKTPPFCRS